MCNCSLSRSVCVFVYNRLLDADTYKTHEHFMKRYIVVFENDLVSEVAHLINFKFVN